MILKGVITDSPKRELLRHLRKNFSEILPVEIHLGFAEQIRIRKEQYEELPNQVKEVLKEHAEKPLDNVSGVSVYPEGSRERLLYERDFYWSNCDAYIFNYQIKKGLVLRTKCKYNIEGLEESDEIYFLNKSEFPTIILHNLGSAERIPSCFFNAKMCLNENEGGEET